MRRRVILPITALAALLLAGCASPAPAPTDTAPAPAPTATSAPTPDAGVVALGGDCELVLPDAALQQAAPGFAPVGTQATSAMRLLGGMECTWAGEDGPAPFQRIWVAVAPRSEVPDDIAARYAPDPAQCGLDDCPSSVPVDQDGLWIALETSGVDHAAVDAAIREAVLAAAPQYEAPRVAEPDPAWWAVPDCDAIGAKAGMAQVLGADSIETVMRSDNIPRGAAWDLTSAAGLTTWCPFTGVGRTAGETYVEFISTAGTLAAPPEGARPVEVAGAVSAWFLGDGDHARLIAVDGVNTLAINYGPDEATVLRTAEAVLPHLTGRG